MSTFPESSPDLPVSIEKSSEEPRGSLPEILFQTRMKMSPFTYAITATDKDRELMHQWKTENIDPLIEEINDELLRIRNGEKISSKKRAMLLTALGENPSNEDIILCAIARFLWPRTHNRHQHLDLWNPKAFLHLARGGTRSLGSLEEGFVTCADTPTLTAELAKLYGIQGTIERPSKLFHYYWKSESGKVVDVFRHKDRFGYVRDPSSLEQDDVSHDLPKFGTNK